MSYEKFYPNGWQSGESGGTPITPEALEHIEKGIVDAYKNLAPAVESADYPGCYYRTVNGVVEWINPPMVLGVEYRTTRRSNGKVVYAKKVNLGTVVHQGEYSTGVSGDLVEWVATLPGVGLSVPYNGINTDYYSTTSVNVGLSITSGVWRTHWVIGTNYSGKYTAHVELWYTKN